MFVTKVYSSWPEESKDPENGSIVGGCQDHWAQGTQKDLERILSVGILDLNATLLLLDREFH